MDVVTATKATTFVLTVEDLAGPMSFKPKTADTLQGAVDEATKLDGCPVVFADNGDGTHSATSLGLGVEFTITEATP